MPYFVLIMQGNPKGIFLPLAGACLLVPRDLLLEILFFLSGIYTLSFCNLSISTVAVTCELPSGFMFVARDFHFSIKFMY